MFAGHERIVRYGQAKLVCEKLHETYQNEDWYVGRGISLSREKKDFIVLLLVEKDYKGEGIIPEDGYHLTDVEEGLTNIWIQIEEREREDGSPNA